MDDFVLKKSSGKWQSTEISWHKKMQQDFLAIDFLAIGHNSEDKTSSHVHCPRMPLSAYTIILPFCRTEILQILFQTWQQKLT